MNTQLKNARTAAGLTAIRLAELAGTREMRVYAFERERQKPRSDEAVRIARVLGKEPSDIFPGWTGGES